MPYVPFIAGAFASGSTSVDLGGSQIIAYAGSLSVVGTANIALTGVSAIASAGFLPETNVEWDPAHKHTGYTLSNSNLTCTVTDDGGGRLDNASVRAVTARSSGKKYIEIDTDCSHVSQYGAVGLATSGLSASHYVGETAASWGYFTSGGVYHNAGLIQTYGAWVSFQPAQFAMAVDFDTGKAWFAMQATGSQTWQGGGDPAAGTSPAFTFTPGTELYPAWTGAENDDYAIIVSTTPTFRFPMPSGYTSWATA